MATGEIIDAEFTVENQALAASKLPAELAILKLENDTIQSLAAARPRNHLTIKKDIMEQLEAYPAFAQSAIYAKPVGKDPATGKQKIARGLSIRAAEALAEAYGFCRIRSDVTIIDDSTVKVEATFTDYQKGRIWQDAGIVSKYYRDRNGKMVRIPDDRFFGVTVKAEASRRIREVIIRSVPPGLRAELQALAEAKLAKVLSGDGIQKIVSAFGKHGVPLQQLEDFVGRSIAAGWTEDDRLNLLGIYQAIEQGETTVAEAFRKETPDNGASGGNGHGNGSGNGTISTSDLTKAKASIETNIPKTQANTDQSSKAESEKSAAEPEKAAPVSETTPSGETKAASTAAGTAGTAGTVAAADTLSQAATEAIGKIARLGNGQSVRNAVNRAIEQAGMSQRDVEAIMAAGNKRLAELPK